MLLISKEIQVKTACSTSILNRRIWLGLLTVVLFFLATSPVHGGRKDDQIQHTHFLLLRCKEMTSWFKSNFKYRAELLEKRTGKPFDLAYIYQSPKEDKIVAALEDKLRVKRVSNSDLKTYIKETEVHIKACIVELGKIDADLLKAEALVLSTLPAEQNIKVKSGNIFGVDIDAARFGVILDASGSMHPHLSKLRAEIARDFPDAALAEVIGCFCHESLEVPWFFVDPLSFNPSPPKVPTWEIMNKSISSGWSQNTVSAFSALIDIKKVDAIYWFSDFRDSIDNDTIAMLSDKITDNGVIIYVHTLEKDPPKIILKLVKKSGGEVIKKRF